MRIRVCVRESHCLCSGWNHFYTIYAKMDDLSVYSCKSNRNYFSIKSIDFSNWCVSKVTQCLSKFSLKMI